MSPILRWAGSKKRSLPRMAPFFPKEIDRYVEVFAGSACLFFYLCPERAVLSDNNSELIRFYRTVAKHPSEVYRLFSSFVRCAETYYSIRAEWSHERDAIRRAAQFLYLNRNCFNGIYRTNTKGVFNVPFSASRVQEYPSEEVIVEASTRLRRASLFNRDFAKVCLETVKDGDFVYLDPPYYVASKRVFREYSSDPFSEADFLRLEAALIAIDRKGARFLLSYPNSREARKLSRQWSSSKIGVRRTIAGDATARVNDTELLIYNYLPNA